MRQSADERMVSMILERKCIEKRLVLRTAQPNADRSYWLRCHLEYVDRTAAASIASSYSFSSSSSSFWRMLWSVQVRRMSATCKAVTNSLSDTGDFCLSWAPYVADCRNTTTSVGRRWRSLCRQSTNNAGWYNAAALPSLLSNGIKRKINVAHG